MLWLSLTLFALFGSQAAGVSDGDATPKFEIVAQREQGKNGGTMTFYSGGKKVFSTQFWESKPIPAGKYKRCSTTRMKDKGYKAVYIPNVKDRTGIFIHQGSSAKDSSGCLVIEKSKIEQVFDTVPRDQGNLIVDVRDPVSSGV